MEHTWFLCCSAGADAGGWHAGQDKWRVGQVELLQPEDEEPFILASVKRGQTRMAVDTYMFKTGDPACKAAQNLPKKLISCSHQPSLQVGLNIIQLICRRM